MSIEKGNDDAMLNYAIMLNNGDGVPVNKSEAIKYFKMSIEKGNDDAMLNYAIMLNNGDGVPVNKSEAIKYYKMSADKGNKKAIHRLKALNQYLPKCGHNS